SLLSCNPTLIGARLKTANDGCSLRPWTGRFRFWLRNESATGRCPCFWIHLIPQEMRPMQGALRGLLKDSKRTMPDTKGWDTDSSSPWLMAPKRGFRPFRSPITKSIRVRSSRHPVGCGSCVNPRWNASTEFSLERDTTQLRYKFLDRESKRAFSVRCFNN